MRVNNPRGPCPSPWQAETQAVVYRVGLVTPEEGERSRKEQGARRMTDSDATKQIEMVHWMTKQGRDFLHM